MKRLNFEEGLDLFTHAPTEKLQAMAQQVRNEKNPPKRVTFVLDTNPNYTNVCNAYCTFCAFYREAKAKDSYTKSVEEVMQDLQFASDAGLTTVLLQGGLNEALPLSYYVTLVKECRKRFPHLNPHFFTAPEIYNLAKIEQLPYTAVFQALYDAGQRTFPGGGSEILSERVRKKISPKKMEEGAWIEIHKAAHEVGFISTATMMYGHVETPWDIVTHLEALRTLQDKTHGFTAFIPWSYKRDFTALQKKVKHWAGADAYFRILAFSRLYLDNFEHIQASWFSEGKEIGVQALHYGADDFGGTITTENVHKMANFVNKTDHQGMIDMIQKAGFEPAQRNTFYDILRTYLPNEKVEVPFAQRPQVKDHTPILETCSESSSVKIS